MERLAIVAEMFVEDVNKEDSVIVELIGRIVHVLFKIFQVAGIPFLLYVLMDFIRLF